MFQRLFVSFEMHRTRSLDTKLFAPADARVGDRNWRAEHDYDHVCRSLIDGYTQSVRSNVRY